MVPRCIIHRQVADELLDPGRGFHSELFFHEFPVEPVLADRVRRVVFGKVGRDHRAVGALPQRLARDRGEARFGCFAESPVPGALLAERLSACRRNC